MTMDEFVAGFATLQQAYDMQHTKGEIQSYFAELGHADARDFARAVARIPANEPRTNYRPFPSAKTIRDYVLDAQESRRLQEQRTQPRGVVDVVARSLKHKHTPEQLAWGKLCATLALMSLGGVPLSRRVALIEAFIDEHGPWLAIRSEEREWLQDKLRALEERTVA